MYDIYCKNRNIYENLNLIGINNMPIKIGDIKLYSVIELSKKLNVTPLTLRTYIKQGRLKGRKVGGRWLLSENSLREFFNSSNNHDSKKIKNSGVKRSQK